MIETVLLRHLQAQGALKPYLAEYCGESAIFNQEAPADTDENWSDEQYGRMVFFLNMRDDPARKISGALTVDLICRAGVQIPEDIEPVIKSVIDGHFFTSGNETIAAQWNASDYFAEPTQKTNGVTMLFDLLAFPHQATRCPDPVLLLNRFSKELMPEAHVIGHDVIEAVFKPDNDNPAVYWRQTGINKCSWIPDTYHCSWHTATLQGHVFAADQNMADSIARHIDNTLTIKKRLIFDDMSPLMTDRNIRLNFTADALRTGQITIDATFGILNIPEEKEKLRHVHMKQEGGWHGRKNRSYTG